MAELVLLPAVCCFAFLAMLGIAWWLIELGRSAERERAARRARGDRATS